MSHLNERLLEEKDKGRDLQAKLDVLGDYDVEELKKELERTKKSEKDLEMNLKIICENPWFSNTQNQMNIAQKLKVLLVNCRKTKKR